MKKSKKINKKNRNFFSTVYKESFDYIKESKNFIYTIIAVFFFSCLLGFFVQPTGVLETKILEFIENLLDKTENMSQFELIKFIFLNNLQSSFIGMLFGIALGIFPVLITLANGYLLGFVAARTVGVEGIFVLWRLFPHGIFELPALFISLGLGLKMGTFLFKKDKIGTLNNYLVNSAKVFFFVVIPLLLLAAIIEGSLIAFSG